MAYKVAVLMGGNSFERDFSLASGKHVIKALEREGHTVLPLDTTPALVDILRTEKPDVAYIALHGGHGEDGTIQALLEYLAIPFVGSPSAVCRTTWNKSMLPIVIWSHRAGGTTATGPASWPKAVSLSKTAFKDLGAASALTLVTERIPSGYPYAVLPASGGSAMGISKVGAPEQLASALLDALSFDDEVLIEEWISGVELAVCIMGAGKTARVLSSVEICTRGGFFSTEVRVDPDLYEYHAPVRADALSADPKEAERIRELIEAAALEVHRSFGCRDLSRVDCFWDGTEVKVLECNVSPGMAQLSLFPLAAEAAGLGFGALLSQMLDVAVARGCSLA
ncbi:MAG: D-alanine--D-alanine ligase [Coriobacteriales bacterium]|jgi:D-alanine-D-alanine ligase|nr:D-alanine--D-alanine ligase [Coriobacteriales bacterium]